MKELGFLNRDKEEIQRTSLDLINDLYIKNNKLLGEIKIKDNIIKRLENKLKSITKRLEKEEEI